MNLAVDMVVGAYEERFDVAMLVTGDTDCVRTIQAVQPRSKRVVWCHHPAPRTSPAWRSWRTGGTR